jgi:hypothetical protein
MGFFTRRSKFDDLVESAGSAVTGAAVRRIGKLGAGVVAGVVGLTAASAAISSARQQEQR